MEIKRRGFLGTVIGALVLSKKAFTATPPVEYEIPQENDSVAHKLRAMDLSELRLKDFKGFYILGTGEKIASPPIIKIVKYVTIFKHIWRIDFVFDDIEVNKPIEVRVVGLIDDLGKLIGRKEISPPVYVLPSDTLKITHSLFFEAF